MLNLLFIFNSSVNARSQARQKVMTLELRSKSEWDEFVADGKRGFGPYLPNRPDEGSFSICDP